MAKLRALLDEARKDLQRIESLQNTLAESLADLWTDLDVLISNQSVWKETLSLVASGRVLGVAAQAEECLASNANNDRSKTWISDGSGYSRWLSKGVTHLVHDSGGHDIKSIKAAAQLCGKSFSIGHAGG